MAALPHLAAPESSSLSYACPYQFGAPRKCIAFILWEARRAGKSRRVACG